MSSPFRRAVEILAVGLALASCERDRRPIKPGDVAAYETNAFHIAQGAKYYRWFNCNGCHANGGGGMGPALMDAEWRYGGELTDIRATILEGRPNGMPSFDGKIPDEQVWQIAAYVRSMSGNVNKLAAPSRSDKIRSVPPLSHMEPLEPRPEKKP